jgi:nicotinate-nucleotide adenylyltransferase
VRIAIIGGTFDPIHNGHLAAAESVANVFNVDQVHFVPAFSPPHKQSIEITSPFHRFAMVALAAMPFAKFRPSTIEVDALEKRYTVQTLEAMHCLFPGAELIFIAGTDMYEDIETWKDFRRLFELANIAIVSRPGFPFREDVALAKTIAANQSVDLPAKKSVFYLPFIEQPISSTEIRADIRNARQWLPAPVWSYIEKNNLYSAQGRQ